MYRSDHTKKPLLIWLVVLLIATVVVINNSQTLASPSVQNRFARLSNADSGEQGTYLVGFTPTDITDPVGSILIQFCSESPLIGDTCTFPSGMDINSVVLSNQTGNTGFAITNFTGGQIVLSRNPSNPSATPSTYQLDNILNPSSAGEYYVRIQTFSSVDATGPNVEQGGIAIAINPALSVSAVVPPYLSFCAAISIPQLNCASANGDQINFGNFSTHSTSDGTSQFIVATNAGNGYNVTVTGTSLTSGNDVIPAMTVPGTSKTGNSQFGMNLTSNVLPPEGSGPSGPGPGTVSANYNISNNYLFNDGDIVAGSTVASDFNEFTTSYIVNVNPAQPGGIYSTTISYICLANF